MTQQVCRHVVIVLVLLLSAACSYGWGTPQILRVDDILESATALEGRQVEVKGFLRFGDDTQNLWTSRDAYSAVSGRYVPPESPLWNHCVSLFDTKKLRSTLLRYDSRDVLVRGRVTHYRRDSGDIAFSSCSEVGIAIVAVTLSR